jgi:hypothetical protein
MTALRTSRAFHSAILLAAGMVVGGGLLGGLPLMADAASTEAARPIAQATDRCAGPDEVATFVCRNTWLAATRYANR